jgi:hypothetical protein
MRVRVSVHDKKNTMTHTEPDHANLIFRAATLFVTILTLHK